MRVAPILYFSGGCSLIVDSSYFVTLSCAFFVPPFPRLVLCLWFIQCIETHKPIITYYQPPSTLPAYAFVTVLSPYPNAVCYGHGVYPRLMRGGTFLYPFRLCM